MIWKGKERQAAILGQHTSNLVTSRRVNILASLRMNYSMTPCSADHVPILLFKQLLCCLEEAIEG